MRGDSVRDLYAKALALMGLGVLAGAGALVDYWPVRSPLPRVSFNAPASTGLRPLGAEGVLAESVVGTPAVRAPRMTAVPTVTASTTAAAFVETLPSVERPAESVVVASPAAEPPQPETTALDVQPADITALSAAAVELTTPVPFEPLGVSQSSPPAAPSTNAFQKAGNTLLNGAFAVGTGVAKGLAGFGTAIGNIGKLFSRSSH